MVQHVENSSCVFQEENMNSYKNCGIDWFSFLDIPGCMICLQGNHRNADYLVARCHYNLFRRCGETRCICIFRISF